MAAPSRPVTFKDVGLPARGNRCAGCGRPVTLATAQWFRGFPVPAVYCGSGCYRAARLNPGSLT